MFVAALLDTEQINMIKAGQVLTGVKQRKTAPKNVVCLFKEAPSSLTGVKTSGIGAVLRSKRHISS